MAKLAITDTAVQVTRWQGCPLVGYMPCAEAAVGVEVEEVFLIELAVRDEDGSEIVDESSSLLLR